MLHGDVIRDRRDRAVDVEFLRGDLRDGSGDRPRGSDLGLQGGRFESWTILRRNEGGRFDPNFASERDFVAIPGVGATTARRIIRFRRENGAISLSNIRSIPGLSPTVVNRLTQRLILQ